MCSIKTHPRRHVQDHEDYTARARQRELNHTDQESIWHERSTSWGRNRLSVWAVDTIDAIFYATVASTNIISKFRCFKRYITTFDTMSKTIVGPCRKFDVSIYRNFRYDVQRYSTSTDPCWNRWIDLSFLQALLSSAKARYAALEGAVHCLTIERSRYDGMIQYCSSMINY